MVLHPDGHRWRHPWFPQWSIHGTAQLSLLLILILNFGSLKLFAQDYIPNELIIKTRTKLSPSGGPQKGLFGKLASKGMSFKGHFSKLQMHLLVVPPGQDLQRVMKDLQEDPEIEYAEPNFILHKAEEATSVIETMTYDEMRSSVHSASNGSYSQSSAPVGLDVAWTEMNSDLSNHPIVAVLDTGIDYNHELFKKSQSLWRNPKEIPENHVDDDGNGYVDDIYGWNFFANHNRPWDDDGHGTHVSGIVVGTTIDIFEDPLRTSLVQVMPLKFLGADGSGDTANAIRAIDYAISNGARIINASWGGDSYSRSLHDAFSRAYSAGLLIVAAAGNFGSNNDSSPIYPSSLNIPGLVSVAASNSWDGLASFSNYGIKSVHVAAPGVTIGSSYPNNKYGYSSGTSMAAPFVAGVGALLLREASHLTGFQLKELILGSVKISSQFSQKIYTSGRVNALEALRSAKNSMSVEAILPTYTPTVPERALASENEASSGGGNSSSKGNGGCGTLATLKAFQSGRFPPSGPEAMPVILLLCIPFVFWALLRRSPQEVQANVPEFELRFATRMQVSDQVLVKTRVGSFEANLKNISKGGLAFQFHGKRVAVDEQVTFIFTNRKGGEQIEVAGRIVWTDQETMAGVQFHNLNTYVQSFLLRTYSGSY